MRTGIVYMVATVLCIFVTSCFTGVESTKKITMPDTGEIAAQSPEDRFIESYFVQQGCDTWRIGKPFYYTDEKLSFVFRPEKPTFPDSISLKGKIFTYAGSIEESPFGGDDKVVLLFDCEGHKFRYETGKTREEIGRLKYTPLIPPFIDIDDLNMARSLLKDRVLYIKTPMWYNEKSEAIEGRKLIPVRVVDIRPGNNVLPVEVWFEDDKRKSSGSFHVIAFFVPLPIYHVRPLVFFPRIRVCNIRKYRTMLGSQITLGKVKTGMTKAECKLSLGNPNEVKKIPTYSGLREQWIYNSGAYLFFVDDLLADYRL